MSIIDIVCFILGAFFGALIGDMIGRKRGRPTAGMWLGLLLGPLGWLIVFLGADERPKCPECRGVIEEGASRCKNCGVEFGAEERDSVPLTLPSPGGEGKFAPYPRIHRPTPRVRSA